MRIRTRKELAEEERLMDIKIKEMIENLEVKIKLADMKSKADHFHEVVDKKQQFVAFVYRKDTCFSGRREEFDSPMRYWETDLYLGLSTSQAKTMRDSYHGLYFYRSDMSRAEVVSNRKHSCDYSRV